jgi:hypothetical protein
MRIFSRVLFIFIAVFLMSFAACNDGGTGDSDTAQAEAPTYDASGNWIISMSYAQDYGMNDCELLPNISYDTITQSGSTFSLDGKEGGSIDGPNYFLQYSYTPSDSNITYTITSNFTMSSEDAIKGTVKVYATNGSASAERMLNMEAKRADDYTYDATGTWRITAGMKGINYCGKLVSRTFDISFDQRNSLFEITGDLDGDAVTESMYGAVVGSVYEGIFNSADGSSKGIISNFTLTSKNSMSGTLEVYDCGSTDCKTTYNITGTKISD